MHEHTTTSVAMARKKRGKKKRKRGAARRIVKLLQRVLRQEPPKVRKIVPLGMKQEAKVHSGSVSMISVPL